MSRARDDWHSARKKQRERRDSFEASSVPLEPVYTPDDLADFDHDSDLGYPGAYPYTRGVQPTMYRGRLWTMRQYAGFGSAAETNHRFRYLLSIFRKYDGLRGYAVYCIGCRFFRFIQDRLPADDSRESVYYLIGVYHLLSHYALMDSGIILPGLSISSGSSASLIFRS